MFTFYNRLIKNLEDESMAALPPAIGAPQCLVLVTPKDSERCFYCNKPCEGEPIKYEEDQAFKAFAHLDHSSSSYQCPSHPKCFLLRTPCFSPKTRAHTKTSLKGRVECSYCSTPSSSPTTLLFFFNLPRFPTSSWKTPLLLQILEEERFDILASFQNTYSSNSRLQEYSYDPIITAFLTETSVTTQKASSMVAPKVRLMG